MRITTKRYDPDKAKYIGHITATAFGGWDGDLYRKRTGEYFLETRESETRTRISPLSYEEAAKLMKKAGLKEETPDKVTLCLQVSGEAGKMLERLAEGTSKGKTVERLIRKEYQGRGRQAAGHEVTDHGQDTVGPDRVGDRGRAGVVGLSKILL